MEELNGSESVNSIFRQRESFIIIGLTGRTGAGCSTVASILSKETFDKLDLKSYKTCDYNNTDERKYSVIYRFMKEGDKWVPFHVIEASTIIFSFIAEGTFGAFYAFLNDLSKQGRIDDVGKIKEKIYNSFACTGDEDKYRENDAEQEQKQIFPELVNLAEYVGNNSKDNRENKDDGANKENVYDVIHQYCKVLKDKKDNFRKILSGYQFAEYVKKDKAGENAGIEKEAVKKDIAGKGAVEKEIVEKDAAGKDAVENDAKDASEKVESGVVHDLYSHIMQVAGNNIRRSGRYNSEERKPGKEIAVAERINNLIKVINCYEEMEPSLKPEDEKEEKKKEKKVRICIDALRNTFEIQYFRDKYRSFYAVAVNTEDKDRVQRLSTTFNKRQMSSLDKMEYPENKTQFYKQNIQGCLEISDIYLYNPNVADRKYYTLTEQLVKYIALMLHPGLVSPTHLERCMQLAFNAKYNSGCLSRKVGAVVTGADFSVRSVGWNDVPKGQVPCNLRCVEDYCRNKDKESFSEFELTDEVFDKVMNGINKEIGSKDKKAKMKGKTFQYCFKDVYIGITGSKNQVYTRALHAEENAFLQIAKYGGAEIQGGKLFTTASPCELCSKKAYQLGIKEIYYIDPYPGISKSHILTFGKHNNPKMILFMGAIGDAYISLYSPRIAYKDELELQTRIKVKEVAKKVAKEVAKKKDNHAGE